MGQVKTRGVQKQAGAKRARRHSLSVPSSANKPTGVDLPPFKTQEGVNEVFSNGTKSFDALGRACLSYSTASNQAIFATLAGADGKGELITVATLAAEIQIPRESRPQFPTGYPEEHRRTYHGILLGLVTQLYSPSSLASYSDENNARQWLILDRLTDDSSLAQRRKARQDAKVAYTVWKQQYKTLVTIKQNLK